MSSIHCNWMLTETCEVHILCTLNCHWPPLLMTQLELETCVIWWNRQVCADKDGLHGCAAAAPLHTCILERDHAARASVDQHAHSCNVLSADVVDEHPCYLWARYWGQWNWCLLDWKLCCIIDSSTTKLVWNRCQQWWKTDGKIELSMLPCNCPDWRLKILE